MIGNKDFWPAINNIDQNEQGDVEAALKQWQAALAIDKQQQNLRWQWRCAVPKATARV